MERYRIKLAGEHVATLLADSPEEAVHRLKREAGGWLKKGVNKLSGASSDAEYSSYVPTHVVRAKNEDFEVEVIQEKQKKIARQKD